MSATPEERIEALRAVWGAGASEAELVLFLTLPPEKQQSVLERLPAILRFLAGTPVAPGEIERTLGISRPYFYATAAAFRTTGSIASLVPWPGVSRTRGRSDAEAAEIDRIVADAVAGLGPFGAEELAARLRRALGERAPAPATAYAMAAAAAPRVLDGFRLLPRWAATGFDGAESAFGGLIVLDQVPIEQSATRFLSLVMDARTRFVLGFEDGDGGPAALSRAVWNAGEMAAGGLLPPSAFEGMPYLRAVVGAGPDWERLRRALSYGFLGGYHQSAVFRSGAFTQRMLGGRLAAVDLSAVSRRRRREWTRAEVGYAVGAHNRSRVILHPELVDLATPDRATAADGSITDELVLGLFAFRHGSGEDGTP